MPDERAALQQTLLRIVWATSGIRNPNCTGKPQFPYEISQEDADTHLNHDACASTSAYHTRLPRPMHSCNGNTQHVFVNPRNALRTLGHNGSISLTFLLAPLGQTTQDEAQLAQNIMSDTASELS